MTAADKQTETLNTVLIAFEGGRAILPNSLVVEALPYAPSLSLEHGPPWIVGTLLWQSDTIPLVSLEGLFFAVAPETVQYRRMLVVHALGNYARLRYFAILTTETPQQVMLRRSDIKQDDETDVPKGGLGCAVAYKRAVIIPDLDLIEAELAKVMRR